jgi:hypothetical protein
MESIIRRFHEREPVASKLTFVDLTGSERQIVDQFLKIYYPFNFLTKHNLSLKKTRKRCAELKQNSGISRTSSRLLGLPMLKLFIEPPVVIVRNLIAETRNSLNPERVQKHVDALKTVERQLRDIPADFRRQIREELFGTMEQEMKKECGDIIAAHVRTHGMSRAQVEGKFGFVWPTDPPAEPLLATTNRRELTEWLEAMKREVLMLITQEVNERILSNSRQSIVIWMQGQLQNVLNVQTKGLAVPTSNMDTVLQRLEGWEHLPTIVPG